MKTGSWSRAARWTALFAAVTAGVLALWPVVGPRFIEWLDASPWRDEVVVFLRLPPGIESEAFTAVASSKLLNRLLFAWVLVGMAWMARAPVYAAAGFSLGYLVIAAATTPTPGFTWQFLLTEGGVTEISTAVGFVMASALFAWKWLRDSASRNTLMLFFAGLFFFLAGEETSWLQHAFEYETVDSVARWNTQGEFNIHNLGSSTFFNDAVLVFAVGLYGLLPAWSIFPSRRAAAIKLFFGGFGAYFVARSVWELPQDPPFIRGLLALAAIACIAAALTARRLAHAPPLSALMHAVVSRVHFSRAILIAAAILGGTYLAYGIRFRCLGALQFGEHTYEWNFDDEVLELFVALMGVALAAGQRRSETPAA